MSPHSCLSFYKGWWIRLAQNSPYERNTKNSIGTKVKKGRKLQKGGMAKLLYKKIVKTLNFLKNVRYYQNFSKSSE